MPLLVDFDSSNESHVRWLKELVDADVEKKVEVLQKNPLREQVPSFDVIHIMFGLCAKYTKAVFDKKAFLI